MASGPLPALPGPTPPPLTQPPPPPSLPIVLPPPAICPPGSSSVCATEQQENGSSTPPPSLPSQPERSSSCVSGSASAAAANTWTQYGSAQVVDYRDFSPAPSQSDTSQQPAAQQREMFPIPIVPVIDPAVPCRAYRLSSDAQRIERSLDGGRTWEAVLDGGAMHPAPHFRRIYIGGQATSRPIVYVSEVSNGGYGLLKSTDGGSTWQLADGWDAAHPDSPNLVGAYVFSVTTSAQDPYLLYVVEAVCQDNRPHAATTCENPEGQTPAYDTSDQEPFGGLIGGVRMYVTRDGGGTWARLADPNGNAANDVAPVGGVPETCDMQYAWIVDDPQSTSVGGVLHDRIWIVWRMLGYQCEGNLAAGEYWLEGTWDGSTADATLSYGFQLSNHNAATGTLVGAAPFAVEHVGNVVRLVSANPSAGGDFWSPDDGVTWNPINVNNASPSSVLVDPGGGNLFTFAQVGFGEYENGGFAAEPRPYVMVPNAGGYDVHLGATFPAGLSDYARYGSAYAAEDQYQRSLFDWPGYDPLIPALFSATRTEAYYGAAEQRDDAGDYYVAIETVCYDASCRWDGAVPDSLVGRKSPIPTTWAQWRVMRYTPPASVDDLVTLVNPFNPSLGATSGGPKSSAICAQKTRCSLVPIAQCTISQDAQDQNGVLTYDGRELLYSVTGEAGPQPYTAVVHRLDPAQCTGSGSAVVPSSGAVVIRFAPQQYDLARRLTWLDARKYGYISQPAVPATQPTIDTMSYDATHDRLYFTLSPYVDDQDGGGRTYGWPMANQLSLWSADLHSSGGVPASTVDAQLVTVDTGYCPSFGEYLYGGDASQALAFDRVDDSIWACLPGRPAKLDTSGRQVDEPCYETVDVQGNDNTGIHVFSWSMQDLKPGSASNRAYLLEEQGGQGTSGANLVQFDMGSCQEGRDYSMPAGLIYPKHGSLTLACDPVDFGTGAGSPNTAAATSLETKYKVAFPGTPAGAVMWSKLGNQLTALLLPDNADTLAQQTEGLAIAEQDAQTCRLPLDLSTDAPASVPLGSSAGICATLSVHGPAAPVSGQPVTAEFDGVNVSSQLGHGGLTGSDGRVCLPSIALSAGLHVVRFAYDPRSTPTNLAFYPADVEANVLVGNAPAVPGPAAVSPNNGGFLQPSKGAVSILPPLNPTTSNVGAAAPPGGQVQQFVQGQAQPVAAEQREEQHELAYAYEFPDEEQAGGNAESPAEAPNTHAMVGLDSSNGREILTGAALSAVTLATMSGLAVCLRWSYTRRRSHALARNRRTRRW